MLFRSIRPAATPNQTHTSNAQTRGFATSDRDHRDQDFGCFEHTGRLAAAVQPGRDAKILLKHRSCFSIESACRSKGLTVLIPYFATSECEGKVQSFRQNAREHRLDAEAFLELLNFRPIQGIHATIALLSKWISISRLFSGRPEVPRRLDKVLSSCSTGGREGQPPPNCSDGPAEHTLGPARLPLRVLTTIS